MLPNVPMPPANDRFAASQFKLKRKLLKLVGADFYVFDASERLVLFVNQKGFKLREDIRAYTDESKTQEIFRISARQVMDFAGAYDVIDSATNARIGVLKRKGWKSLIRDEWVICNAQEAEIGTLMEDNMALALIRRFLTNLIPQNYDLTVGGARHVDYRQNFNPFTYHLNIIIENRSVVDPRVAIASAIMLAAIEGRQN